MPTIQAHCPQTRLIHDARLHLFYRSSTASVSPHHSTLPPIHRQTTHETALTRGGNTPAANVSVDIITDGSGEALPAQKDTNSAGRAVSPERRSLSSQLASQTCCRTSPSPEHPLHCTPCPDGSTPRWSVQPPTNPPQQRGITKKTTSVGGGRGTGTHGQTAPQRERGSIGNRKAEPFQVKRSPHTSTPGSQASWVTQSTLGSRVSSA